VSTSEGEPPRCDVLVVYCDIGADGSVHGSKRRLRELIEQSGAAIVVVAKEQPFEAYLAGAPAGPVGQTSLVMTLDRKGSCLATFLNSLFTKMQQGKSMPEAWGELAPQAPDLEHPNAPETIFACERGAVTFTRTETARVA
jgi:hypothetical protein